MGPKVRNETFAADVLRLAPSIRRIARARLSNGDLVEDVVQETLTRLLEARPRLEQETLASYATVTARNLAVSVQRRDEINARNIHRVLQPDAVASAEQEVLDKTEREALAAALEQMPTREREALLDHEVRGKSTSAMARATGSTPGAEATLLARARARLRVGFVLAYRRVDLPTPDCYPVLLALSAGDARKQRQLRAGDHLLECAVCSSLGDPLTRRSRRLAALAPFVWTKALWARLIGRHGPAQQGVAIGASVVTVAAAAVVVLTLSGGDRHDAATKPSARLLAAGNPVLPALDEPGLARFSGETVTARDVNVESVPSDEGFWVGPDKGRRVWVQIDTTGESKMRIRSRQRVSFRGKLVPHQADFVRALGLGAGEGAAELRRQGHHIVARTISPGP